MRFREALQHTVFWKVLNTILTFFINVLLVRMLGASFSGPFFYTITALSFLVLIFSWSIESAITYYGSKNAVNIPSLSRFILPLMTVQALVCMLVLKFFPLSIDTRLAFIYIIGNLAILYFTALFSAQRWFASLNVIIVLVNLLLAIALGGMYFFNTPVSTNITVYAATHPQVLYIYSFAMQGIALMLYFFARRKNQSAVTEKNNALIKKIIQYATVAFVSNLLFFLVTRIDYFFVHKYCTAVALSNYIQVSKFGQLLLFLPSLIAIVIFPYASGDDEDNYLDKVQFFCRVITGSFIPLLLIISATGYWVFPWLFGAGFTAMYPAMLFYFAGFFSLSMITVLASYLAGKAMLRANLNATIIALIIVVTGDVIFIPLWGINAAAAVSSLGYFACLVYLLWIFKKTIGCRITSFFAINKSDLRLLLNFLNNKKADLDHHQ